MVEILGVEVASWLMVGLVTCLLWLTMRRPRGLPPGPAFILPLVGHLPLMRGDPRETLKAMRLRYGDVFHLYLGSRLVVVLNGYDVIMEAFVKYGDVFSYRPDTVLSYDVIHFLGVTGSSGERWKEQRTFVDEILQDSGFHRNVLQDKIIEEVSIFVDTIKQKQGQEFDIECELQKAVSNVICNIVIGKRFDLDDPEFLRHLDKVKELTSLSGRAAVVNFFPWLRFLPADPFGVHRIRSCVQDVEKTFARVAVQEHLQNFHAHSESMDFTHAYIKEIQRLAAEGKQTSLNVQNLVKVICDLFVAGTDTTSTTIRWALLLFLHYPDVQDNVYAEIHSKVGSERLPRMRDRADLPYVEAFVLEVLRFSNITLLSVPHCSSADVWFRGHFIPRGADLFPNSDSIQNDPDLWDDPELFRPERFLEDGKLIKREKFIPFSLGQRSCPGESLARMELFLFLATLVQRFRFVSPDDGAVPDMEGNIGLVHAPLPFRLRAVPRSED